jgi:hypothetical protein
MYGRGAEDEAGKHLALLEEYQGARFILLTIEDGLAEKEPGVTEEHVQAHMQQISELKERIFQSWEKVRKQPGVLHNLAKVAERDRDRKGPMFEVEYAVLLMYRCGIDEYQKLLAIAHQSNPDIKLATFSKIVKRYKLALRRRKSGPRPEKTKRSGVKR